VSRAKAKHKNRVETAAQPEQSIPEAPRPPEASEERIREAAYLKWEAAGRPDGDGVDFWLRAERELR
jgi:hypothetical protein